MSSAPRLSSHTSRRVPFGERRYPPGTVALAVGAGLTALAVVLWCLVASRWRPLAGWDASVTADLHRTAVAEPGWTQVNRVLTDWVWDPWAMRALLAVCAGWLLLRARRMVAVWVAVAALASAAVQQAVKAVVGRDRPRWPDPVDSAHYASFPSGHAMTAAVAAGLVLWLLHLHAVSPVWLWAVGAMAALSVVGVGFTRVYLGVHWPTDVLAGWLMGGAVAAVAAGAYARRHGHGAGERHGPPRPRQSTRTE